MHGIGTAGVGEGAGRNNAHLATGTVFLPLNLPLLILLIDITLEFENVIQPGEKLDFPLRVTRTGRPARLGQMVGYKTPRGKPKRSCRSKELSSWVWTRTRNKTSGGVRLIPLAEAALFVFPSGLEENRKVIIADYCDSSQHCLFRGFPIYRCVI